MPVLPEPPRALTPVRLSARRIEILEGTQAIVLREGFRSLRLGDLAKRLSSSNTTLYQLASTKDELVMLAVDRWYRASGATTWRAAVAAPDPVARLERWLLGGVEGVRVASSAFWNDAASHAGVAQLVESYRRYYIAVLEALVRDGIERHCFRPLDPRMVAVVVDAAAGRLHDPREDADLAAYSPAERGEQLVDLILHGISREVR